MSPLMMLGASLASLGLAPVIGISITRIPELAERALALILVLIVVLLALPEAWTAAGAWVVPTALLGLLGPNLTERWATHHTAHAAPLAVIAGGFLVHAGLDGAALGTGKAHLGLAVVLHRLPAAAATWWTVEHEWGRKAAALVLVGGAACTLVGFALGAGLDGTADSFWVGLISALSSGALCHVVLHSPDHDHGHTHHHA